MKAFLASQCYLCKKPAVTYRTVQFVNFAVCTSHAGPVSAWTQAHQIKLLKQIN